MSSPQHVDLEPVGIAIESEAEQRRRQDREIALLELEIEQIWADLTPSPDSAETVGDDGLLLDQTASMAALDPQVPIGSRRGLRGVKWLIRKLTYWYVRFLTDQFNVFAGLLIRHLRSLETRLRRLESGDGLPLHSSAPPGLGLLDDPPEPSAAVVSTVAGLVKTGPCLVLSAGEGAIVEAISARGISAHGVEQDPNRALTGLSRGIDMRTGDALAHIVALDDDSLDAIVLTGFVERLPLSHLLGVIDQSCLKLRKSGRIIVAAADPKDRGRVEAELGSGLGLSPVTWRHLLAQAGLEARLETCPDSRITEIVVAERPASAPDAPGRGRP